MLGESTTYQEDDAGCLHPIDPEIVAMLDHTPAEWDKCIPTGALIKREEFGGDPLAFPDLFADRSVFVFQKTHHRLPQLGRASKRCPEFTMVLPVLRYLY